MTNKRHNLGFVIAVALLMTLQVGRCEVMISEFMASNTKTIKDDFGRYSDWIEIYNGGSAPVNLGGWSLTDETNNLAKWKFPSTNLNARAFMVVFASGDDRKVAGGALHTNFKLDAAGEFLALVKPDGVTVTTQFAPAYPKQYADVSWGAGETTTLLASNAAGRLLIPTSGAFSLTWTTNTFNDSAWLAATNGVGYETLVPGFAVKVVKSNGWVDSLEASEALLTTPSQQAAVYTENAPVINYVNSGGGGNYADDRLFPGLVGDVEDYVMEAIATLTIPSAGDWTFGVNSDDGFSLQVGDFIVSYPWPRGPDSTLGTLHFDQPGDYPLRLLFYERGGGSEVELWAAKGNYGWWDPSVFSLVGETAAGGLAVTSLPVGGSSSGSYRADIRTDVQESMFGSKVSAYVRLPFQATNVARADSLTLKVKYDDGFVAYLNGVEVARRNAASNPDWSTPATRSHSGAAYELIDITASRNLLREGENLLAVHAMNDETTGTDFLILVELAAFRLGDTPYVYMSPATPALANVGGYPGLAAPVQFSRRGGVITTNLSLTLLSPTPGAKIRYTLNNTVPTEDSALYTKPIVVDGSMAVRARAFAAGWLPGEPVSELYTYIDRTLTNFSTRLPILVIEAYGQTLAPDMQERAAAGLVVIDVPKSTGKATFSTEPEYLGRAGIEGRGQTSWGFPKKPYNVELRDERDQDRKAALLGMPADSDWVLLNVYNDKSFMNDFMAHELFEKMGHYAVRRRYVEVYLNGTRPEGPWDDSPKVNSDDYVGIYVLLERIKVAKDRVDIAKLSPSDTAEPEITGGYMFKKDKDSPGDVSFTTTSGETLKFHDPKGSDLTVAQRNWLAKYVNQYEAALYGSKWKDPAVGYAQYIDVDSFVDNHWIVEFTKQIDGYRLSSYFQKDRGGKIKMEPIWDYNLSFGNADYLEGEYPQGWYWPLIGENEHIWLRRLISAPGDPDFKQKIADRWSVLRTNVLNSANILARIDELAAYLDEAKTRDFNRWPRLGSYVWPNPNGLANATTYAQVVKWVKDWVKNRYNWIDSQYLIPPTLSLVEGPIQSGTKLTLTAVKGSIYYTLDGTDPRRSGGSISASAFQYAGEISLANNARVVARAFYTNAWSGPAASTYYTEIPSLVITEIMYHPEVPAAGSTNVAQDFQYIELMNRGTNDLALNRFHFTEGIQFTFSGGTLAPGQRIVLVKNRAAFESRYGTEIPIGGVFTNALATNGEKLALAGPLEEPILHFAYDQAWYPATDGLGFSLVVTDPYADLNQWGYSTSWRPSGVKGGSPGAADTAVSVAPIQVNEVYASSDLPQVDWVELYNPTFKEVKVGGWFLSDDFSIPRKYRLPDNAVIPAGGYLVLDELQLIAAGTNAFAFSSLGDEAYLFSGDGSELTGYVHGYGFGAVMPGRTMGRYETSVGDVFVPMQNVTSEAQNGAPSVGPVVLNEIHYNPASQGTNVNTLDEFIEIRNTSSQPVPFFESTHPTNTWRVRGNVDFDFPTNVTLAAGSYLLLVNFDPVSNPAQLAAFRSRLSVPSACLVLGPYRGSLDNQGQRISLSQPGAPKSIGTPHPGVVPYYLIDEVTYSSEVPWPSAANGTGQSLQRRFASEYGNDPVNWVAALPTPGSENGVAAGAPPVFTLQPVSVQTSLGETVTLSASATGAEGLVYQWRLEGKDLSGATQPTLELPAIQETSLGRYSVRVSNPYGTALSYEALVQAGTVLRLDRAGDGSILLTVQGAAGSRQVLEGSSRLPAWSPLSTNTIPANGVLRLTNGLPDQPEQYYRTRDGSR
jgi:hypothetical protein